MKKFGWFVGWFVFVERRERRGIKEGGYMMQKKTKTKSQNKKGKSETEDSTLTKSSVIPPQTIKRYAKSTPFFPSIHPHKTIKQKSEMKSQKWGFREEEKWQCKRIFHFIVFDIHFYYIYEHIYKKILDRLITFPHPPPDDYLFGSIGQ